MSGAGGGKTSQFKLVVRNVAFFFLVFPLLIACPSWQLLGEVRGWLERLWSVRC